MSGTGRRHLKLVLDGTLPGKEMPMLASTLGVQFITDQRMGLFSSLALLLMEISSGTLLQMEYRMFGFVRWVLPLQMAALKTFENAWSHPEWRWRSTMITVW